MSKNLCRGEGGSRGWRWHRVVVTTGCGHTTLVQRGLSSALLPAPRWGSRHRWGARRAPAASSAPARC